MPAERFRLQCIGPKEEFELLLDDQGVVLSNAAGETEASFSRAEAHRRFKFPSFFESTRHFGVRGDHDKLFWFVPDRECIDAVRDYLDDTLAAKGPGAISSLRIKGWLFIFAGIVLTLVGIALFVWELVTAIRGNNNTWTYGALGSGVLGLILFARGIAAVAKARRASVRLHYRS
jgi:hypothetical protein